MALLVQFLLRVSFGLALAMATVSPRKVSSGYFRNHLYVILGLSSLASLLSSGAAKAAFVWAVATAVLSYLGSIAWLYEKRRAGVVLLALVAGAGLSGSLETVPIPTTVAPDRAPAAPYLSELVLRYIHASTSGLLLGFTMAAMLLGHWYLNAPGMQLAPLRKLLIAMAAAVAAHAVVCGLGLALELGAGELSTQDWLFVILRWSFGLLGVMILIWLAWETLAVPNTQSATGILYVAVIGVFVGETMSLLLSAESVYPV